MSSRSPMRPLLARAFCALGVSDKADFEEGRSPACRGEPGIGPRRSLPRLLEQAIEPQLTVSMEEVTVGEALVGVICLDACNDQPYLFSRRVSS